MDKPIIADVGEWLRGTGPESDIVISSRIRLARNIVQFPFSAKLEPARKAELTEFLRERILEVKLARDLMYMDLEELLPVDRQYLVERHLISRELADASGKRGVAVGARETMSIMVNEEDHLRIQVLRSGFQLGSTWEKTDRIDNTLEKVLDYAFSPQLGYLTSCPTNAGTGLRSSVMMHLPALVMTKQIEKVFHAVIRISLAVRGLYGEGTQATGDFYQISNQVTLGKSEEEILENIESVVPQIIRYERKTRDALLKDSRQFLEDRVWRAYGMLKNAHIISSEESLHHLSALRLGVNLGLVKGLEMPTVNELVILTQPAHLQKVEKHELSAPERDVKRAALIREKLGGTNAS
ncbi:MAG: protein arginine kinase [Planctomycetota bacterium]